MAWIVEQQHRSGLGQLSWLKVAGPFNGEAEATMIADRMMARNGLSARVAPAPRPPAEALDRVYQGRPCRIVERPRQPTGGGIVSVIIEFADASRATVYSGDAKKVAP